MINWTPYELHTHTNHSDGKHTIEELARDAKNIGLSGFAMTDHNTISTFPYLENEAKANDINIIKGLEWTTFYGHVVLLGIEEYVDWRDVTKENFNEKILKAKDKVKLMGVAHPYRIGGAIATGCNFEYKIKDWNNIDYLEVWSGMMASNKYMNKRAFQLWTDLLNKGYKIPAVSGRDWHKSTKEDKGISATYIGILENQENSTQNILNSIKEGRIVVSMGQVLSISVTNKNNIVKIGDTIDRDQIDKRIKVNVNITKSKIENKVNIDEGSIKIVINSNKREIKSLNTEEKSFELYDYIEDIKWIRGELYGNVDGQETLIAFTNPIYFE